MLRSCISFPWEYSRIHRSCNRSCFPWHRLFESPARDDCMRIPHHIRLLYFLPTILSNSFRYRIKNFKISIVYRLIISQIRKLLHIKKRCSCPYNWYCWNKNNYSKHKDEGLFSSKLLANKWKQGDPQK